jgi:hypothetical protein
LSYASSKTLDLSDEDEDEDENEASCRDLSDFLRDDGDLEPTKEFR